jgi:ubiquinol-cytochrome c reductase cytochrome b subunit
MSAALDSTLRISFDIRGGLLVRQIHHWAALVFVAGIGVHMLRVFFTGAFRKPRELNWVIGFVLFILAMAEGFTGYSLPDDLLSGNGLRIIDGMIKGIPLIGTWTSFLLFGGEFPGLRSSDASTRCTSCCCRRSSSRCSPAPHAHDRQQAHAVRRPGPHEQQRRGLPDDAGLHVEDGRLLLHHVRRDRADRLAVHDQPDLELRSVRPVPGLGRYAARLVHRLRRRRAASRAAAPRVRAVGPHLVVQHPHPARRLGLFIVLVLLYPFIEAWITGDKREHHIAQRPRNARRAPRSASPA